MLEMHEIKFPKKTKFERDESSHAISWAISRQEKRGLHQSNALFAAKKILEKRVSQNLTKGVGREIEGGENLGSLGGRVSTLALRLKGEM